MSSPQYCPLAKLDRILLAADTSTFSEGAVREAIRFAAKCSSRIYAITVMESNPEYATIGSNVFAKEEEEVRNYLESVKSKAEAAGLACQTVLCNSDNPAECIVEEAANRQVDMIVVGRRGRRGLSKLLMGQVAAKVIAHAPCKVLVVPRAAEIGYRHILVATDGSAHAAAAVSEAIAIAKRSGSHILALSAALGEDDLEEASANVRAVEALAAAEGIPVEGLTPMGRAADAVIETAGGRAVDLIVMGTYGRTGLRRLFMGSTTEKVVGGAGCAVLVAKTAEDQEAV